MMNKRNLRVLWFTNTPSLAAGLLNSGSNLGGWIASLELQLKNASNIELGIAFHFNGPESRRLENNGTKYYAIRKETEKGTIEGLFDRWKHKIEDTSVVREYLSIIEEFKPDLIHVFGTEFPYGLICTSSLKIPVIIQIQGNLSSYSHQWFSGLQKTDILFNSSLKNFILGRGIWHEYYYFIKRAKRERKMLEGCRNIIGRTDWDRRITRVLSKNSTYFHCEELLRAEFHGERWNKSINNKKPVLFSTLSAVTYKGLESILMTASLLKDHLAEGIEWHIAGIKGTEEVTCITEKSCKLDFRSNGIYFEGSLNAAQMIEKLKQSDIFVHPSHIENSPNSVCEAMLLGMPVIATNVGGVPSLITDKEEGILVQDGDAYAMAGAILEIINNSDKAVEMGNKARLRAVKRHDPEAVLNTLLQIYQTVKG